MSNNLVQRVRAPGIFVLGIIGCAAVFVVACSDSVTDLSDTPEEDSFEGQFVVSEPIAVLGVSSPAPTLSASPSTVANVAYVSVRPGTFPDGERVEIRNLANGFETTEPIVDGGLDPVAVPANVGDTLEIVLVEAGGNTIRVLSVVPPRRPPVVVRTKPPPRKIDVPLNAPVVIVFSEPVDSAPLTESVMVLLEDQPVSGTLRLQPDQLHVEFLQDDPLEPLTEYRITVSTGLRDLSGDSLETPFESTFITAPPSPPSVSTGVASLVTATGAILNGRVLTIGVSGTAWFEWGTDAGLESYNSTNPQPVEGGFVTKDVSVELSGLDSATAYYYRAVASNSAGTTAGFVLRFATQGTGSLIAFVSNREGNYAIYVMNSAGGSLAKLTGREASTYDRAPTWAPDGSRIAFTRQLFEADDEIYVMNADGSGPVNLTQHSAYDSDPAWSPDGSKIAFNSDRVGNVDLFTMNTDGTGLSRLTIHAADDSHAAWSPDASKIAFKSERTGNRDIFVMNSDGTGVTNLTNDSDFDDMPAWSPDGSKIAFERGPNFVETSIWVMNADGTGRVKLTDGPSDSWPTWSPDGLQIAFHGRITGAGHHEIIVVNADGTNPANITGHPEDDLWAAWQR